jgi:hypothetical protein
MVRVRGSGEQAPAGAAEKGLCKNTNFFGWVV